MIGKKVIKSLLFLALISTGFRLSAQETKETSASVYNDALALLKEKDYVKGLELMEKALELAKIDENEQVLDLAMKNGSFAAYQVGDAKLDAKATDEAIVLFQRGIELDSTRSSNYLGLAKAFEAKEDQIKAIEHYLTCAKLSEAEDKASQAENILKKAEVMVGKTYVAKDYDNAIEMGKMYLISNSLRPEVNYYLARSFQAKEDINMAIQHMNLAIEQSGEEVDDKYYFYLGDILAKAGKNTEAKAAYEKVTSEKYKAQAEYRASQL